MIEQFLAGAVLALLYFRRNLAAIGTMDSFV
jgi:hypothetical protein